MREKGRLKDKGSSKIALNYIDEFNVLPCKLFLMNISKKATTTEQ